MKRVDSQLLRNIGVSMDLPVYSGNAFERGERDMPSIAICDRAGSAGYFLYLYPGYCDMHDVGELIESLEWALDRHAIDYGVNGGVVINGYQAYEYEIEA